MTRHGLPLLSRSRAFLYGAAVAAVREFKRTDWRSLLAAAADRLQRFSRLCLTQLGSLRARPIALALGAAAVLVLGYLAYCLATLSFGGGLVVEPTPSALMVEANRGELFATRGVFKGEKLGVGDLTPELVQAVIAIEDRRFYRHGGIDVRGMMRAAWRNLTGNRIEGASTISQQLVRMMYLSPERTIKRKVQEAMLAVWLEHQISKEEILVRYLNTAYFGAGVYGVDAAAKRYFGKPAKELSLSEAALLAGLVRAPSALAPHRNLDAARARAERVLDAMVDMGAISRETADAARRQPATLRVPPDAPPGTNYFVDAAGAEVKSLVGSALGDLRLSSTLDLKLQTTAEQVVARHLAGEGRGKNVGQAALVAMTLDGAVIAMVGGRDYNESQFNRAMQAKRQPGSLFKLFVYLTALQKGARPDSMMVDRPVHIGDWEPENYGHRYRGPVTLRTAFAHSINSVAVQLAETVGVKNVVEVARKLGVRSDLPPNPSLALGTAEVNLLEMTRAFAAIAANAESVEPYFVRSIARGDQTLYTRQAAAPQPPSDPAARAAMLDLLVSVVREGTARSARIAVPAAGKTGTSQDYRDAWFVGFTPELVVGVWVGNDDNSPMKNVTGGSLPAGIWRDFVTQAGAVRSRPPQPSPAPRVSERLNPPVGAQPAAGVAAVPRSGSLRGQVGVLDTGTLDVQGQVVRLFGVEGATGRMARELARYIGGREAVCEAAPSAGAYRCRVDEQDLSELVLRYGGGRASADAPQDMRSLEAHARNARLGVWRRWRHYVDPITGLSQ